MSTSVKDYVGINSRFEREDGTRMAHEDIYTKVVEGVGLETCIAYIPASQAEIKTALKNNTNLNTIPLSAWDRVHPSFKRQLVALGINSVSQSDTVCTLKQAARMWAEADDQNS